MLPVMLHFDKIWISKTIDSTRVYVAARFICQFISIWLAISIKILIAIMQLHLITTWTIPPCARCNRVLAQHSFSSSDHPCTVMDASCFCLMKHYFNASEIHIYMIDHYEALQALPRAAQRDRLVTLIRIVFHKLRCLWWFGSKYLSLSLKTKMMWKIMKQNSLPHGRWLSPIHSGFLLRNYKSPGGLWCIVIS